MSKKNYKVTTKLPQLPEIDEGAGSLNLFDQENPDINLFNLVDDQMIRLAGSEFMLYKYDPIAVTAELTQFGIELTNDQLFTFNKSYIERRLGRSVIPGDIIKPVFQNQKYEVFEVVEDSFEAYGVYHLVCSAKLLRDEDIIQDTPLTNVSDDIGGYAGIDG